MSMGLPPATSARGRSGGVGDRSAGCGIGFTPSGHELAGSDFHGGGLFGDDGAGVSTLTGLLATSASAGVCDSGQWRIVTGHVGTACHLYGGQMAHPQTRRHLESVEHRVEMTMYQFYP